MDNMDRFMSESSKSYKTCKVKNSARRNSLTRKTKCIDVERKMASAVLNREEKQLREQLKLMHMGKTKTAIMSSMRDRSSSKTKSKKSSTEAESKKNEDLDVDPYPVTFGHHRSRANTIVDKGKLLANSRDRRESKEFEDLHVNTTTGTLGLSRLLPPSSPRRRLWSTSSNAESSHGGGGGGGGCVGGESHWLGDPEAIGSVRRPRKSVEEQGWEKLARREARLSQH